MKYNLYCNIFMYIIYNISTFKFIIVFQIYSVILNGFSKYEFLLISFNNTVAEALF